MWQIRKELKELEELEAVHSVTCIVHTEIQAPVTEAAAESLQLKEPGPLESGDAGVLSALCRKNMDSEAFFNSPVVLLARQKYFQSLGLNRSHAAQTRRAALCCSSPAPIVATIVKNN